MPSHVPAKKSFRLLDQRMARAGIGGEEKQEGFPSELGWRGINHCMKCEAMARRAVPGLVTWKHVAAAELSGLFRI